MNDDIFGEHERAIEAYYYMYDELARLKGKPLGKHDGTLYVACSIVFQTLKEYYEALNMEWQ